MTLRAQRDQRAGSPVGVTSPTGMPSIASDRTDLDDAGTQHHGHRPIAARSHRACPDNVFEVVDVVDVVIVVNAVVIFSAHSSFTRLLPFRTGMAGLTRAEEVESDIFRDSTCAGRRPRTHLPSRSRPQPIGPVSGPVRNITRAGDQTPEPGHGTASRAQPAAPVRWSAGRPCAAGPGTPLPCTTGR